MENFLQISRDASRILRPGARMRRLLDRQALLFREGQLKIYTRDPKDGEIVLCSIVQIDGDVLTMVRSTAIDQVILSAHLQELWGQLELLVTLRGLVEWAPLAVRWLLLFVGMLYAMAKADPSALLLAFLVGWLVRLATLSTLTRLSRRFIGHSWAG